MPVPSNPLVDAARAAQGVPQTGVTPGPQGVPGQQQPGDTPDILTLLKSGQISAGSLLQFIAALVGATSQQQQSNDQGASPIESALMEGGQ